MMGLDFALVARLQAMAAPFGQDALLQFHRQIGYVGLTFVLIHVGLSARWRELWAKLTRSPDTVATSALVVLGALAVLARIGLIVTGETGFVRKDLLARHLPPGYQRFQFFICGPAPMMDAAERALAELGVPDARIHTERFDMV